MRPEPATLPLTGVGEQREDENAVRKSFRVRPSDWAEVERVAAACGVEPTRLVRRLVLLGLDAARKELGETRPRAEV